MQCKQPSFENKVLSSHRIINTISMAMKNLWMISAVAALFVTLTGCDTGPIDDGMSHLVSVEERTGRNVVLTRYEYDDKGQISGTSRTEDGVIVYEETDFVRNSGDWTTTWTRNVYSGPGVGAQKWVETYTSGWGTIRKKEIFQVGPDGSNPVLIEREEVTFNGSRVSGYEYETEREITVRSNYNYNGNVLTYNEQVNPKQSGDVQGPLLLVIETFQDNSMQNHSSIEIRDGDQIVTLQKYTFVGGFPEYKIYAGGNENTGILIERQDNYRAVSGDVFRHDVTKYDADGRNPVVTTFTFTYE